MLDGAASVGLPVPAGAILLDETYHLLLAEDVIAAESEMITVPDPEFLHHTLYAAIRFPKLSGPVALRAAFSFAGKSAVPIFAPSAFQLAVDLNDPAQLAASLSEVWSSALRKEGNSRSDDVSLRRDILIMEMVCAEVSGKAVSERAAVSDQVAYRAGGVEDTLQLPRLGALRGPDSALPPFAQRLQKLLRGVRRTFGRRDLSIEWIDDGRICWLIRLRYES
jgi:hypothetical protein